MALKSSKPRFLRSSSKPISKARRLQASEISLHNVVIRNADGIVIVAPDGVVRFLNPAAETLFNRPASDLIGQLFGFPVVAGETSEIDIVRKGGGFAVAEMRVVEIEWEGEICYLATLRDITYRKLDEEHRIQFIREQEARKQAEATNDLKDAFLALVSHELRTPLTPMIGWLRMLRSGKLDEATSEYAIEVIERNARAQAQSIDDLIDIWGAINHRLRLKCQPVAVAAIIESVVARAAQQLRTGRYSLELTLAQLPQISGDARRLWQIVDHLLANAIKFTLPGGQIKITLTSQADWLELRVSDNGIGIKPELLPEIFERFRQADSTVRSRGGMGIGLALVRNLVELHGGRVWAESAGIGQGATFIVQLPIG